MPNGACSQSGPLFPASPSADQTCLLPEYQGPTYRYAGWVPSVKALPAYSGFESAEGCVLRHHVVAIVGRFPCWKTAGHGSHRVTGLRLPSTRNCPTPAQSPRPLRYCPGDWWQFPTSSYTLSSAKPPNPPLLGAGPHSVLCIPLNHAVRKSHGIATLPIHPIPLALHPQVLMFFSHPTPAKNVIERTRRIDPHGLHTVASQRTPKAKENHPKGVDPIRPAGMPDRRPPAPAFRMSHPQAPPSCSGSECGCFPRSLL